MPPSSLTVLQAQIERITYTNDETGYTVAKVKVYGRRDLVNVIGAMINPTPGEVIRMKGEWGHHPKYGEQFKIVFCETKTPATVLRDQEIPRVWPGQGYRAGHGQEDRQAVQRSHPGRD